MSIDGMNPSLKKALSSLPKLDAARIVSTARECKICGGQSRFYGITDFYKGAAGHRFGASGVSVPWFRCVLCEFLFTSLFDGWTPDEFAHFIYNDDYIKVDPSYVNVRPTEFAGTFGDRFGPLPGLRILDYGSGAGVMVRRLREAGYDIQGYDPFSSPNRPDGQFDLVTCFEVIEHSPDPMGLLRDIQFFLKPAGALLLGEALQPDNIEEIGCNWWYCAPRNGHCSTFGARTLAVAADRLGLCFRPGGGWHALVPPGGGRVADLLARVTGPRLAAITLGAPSAPEASGWNGIETPGDGPFRWTAAASVTWRVPFRHADVLSVRIPVSIAITPEHKQGARILVDGREAETQMRKSGLIATMAGLSATDGVVTVELRTPEPRSPRELRGVPDNRRLGLAVPVLGKAEGQGAAAG